MSTLDADRLQEFFRPKSVALVGATDKSGWSLSTYNNLLQHGFSGDVHLVNPKTPVVHGVETHRSLSAIPGPVDLVYVMTPIEVVPLVLEEALPAASGTTSSSPPATARSVRRARSASRRSPTSPAGTT